MPTAHWHTASALLAAEPSPLVTMPSGARRANPLVQIACVARRDAMMFAREPGIAADLSGIGGDEPPSPYFN